MTNAIIATHNYRMAKHYLSTTEVADRIGVTRGSLSNLKLPPADVTVGTVRGWTEKTIDEWNAARPGRGRSWADVKKTQKGKRS